MLSAKVNTTSPSSGNGGTRTRSSQTEKNDNGNLLLLQALQSHHVQASVTDVHVRRASSMRMTVETDYMVTVAATTTNSTTNASFASFCVSKKYSAFRKLVKQLKAASDAYTTTNQSRLQELPDDAIHVARTCEMVYHLIESQHVEYLGKISSSYVKALAQQRKQVLNVVLETITERFPSSSSSSNCHALVTQFGKLVENFFLTDHVMVIEEHKMPTAQTAASTTTITTSSTHTKIPPPSPYKLVPHSQVQSRSALERAQDEEQISERGATFLMDSEDSDNEDLDVVGKKDSSSYPQSFNVDEILDKHYLLILAIVAAICAMLRQTLEQPLRWDADVSVFLVVAAFLLGRQSTKQIVSPNDHINRQQQAASQAVRPSLVRQSSVRSILRRSMQSTRTTLVQDSIAEADDHDAEAPVLVSTMPIFPPGASLGSVTHCWGASTPSDFMVRGANYNKDRKKEPSGDFLFPTRGVDLFLTDTCPENVGRNSSIFEGKLRDVPTFIINFRLPWGILVFYFEIPILFVPFLRAAYEPDFDKSTLPSLDEMSPGERAVCRFLQADMATKNNLLKIVPIVVEGPWMVKQVVGGKPTIIGKKLPINYVYQSPEGPDKAAYLEADLDIAADAAARSILSIVRSYTNCLTLDLGFVVQGNSADELPERMLVGCRLHGIDPLKAPDYPSTGDFVFVEATETN